VNKIVEEKKESMLDFLAREGARKVFAADLGHSKKECQNR